MQPSHPKLRLGNFLFLIVVFAAVVLCSFRSFGLDFESYLTEYNDQASSVSAEVGYRAVISALSEVAPFAALLALANIIFFWSHRAIWKEGRNVASFVCIISYIIYIGAFLLLGSPRRLIAYSLVIPVLFSVARSEPPGARLVMRILLAATFHTSALITMIYFMTGKTWRELSAGITFKRVFYALGLLVGFAAFAVVSGLYDFIFQKIFYYVVHAESEQEYLAEVPSVWSGLAKRAIVTAFLLFGSWRHSNTVYSIGYRLVAVEAFFYVAGSMISPVIAVVSSYFVIGYLLVALETVNSRTTVLCKCSATTGCMFFFLPTAYGLVSIFPQAFGL